MRRLRSRSLGYARQLQSLLMGLGYEEPKPRAAVMPYISGDAYLAASDIAVLRTHDEPLVIRQHARPEVLFIEGELLESQKYWPLAMECGTVICHNADIPPTRDTRSKLTNLGCRLFGTNVERVTDVIEPIPIGIENLHHCRNGSLHHYNPVNIATYSKVKTRDVLVSFQVGTNSVVRGRFADSCKRYGLINQTGMSLACFRQSLAESYFVISPPGNGIDCHRTWEAMYHNCVPVLEDNYNLFKHIRLPSLSVKNVDDFLSLSHVQMHELYREIQHGIYPALYMDYWIDFIRSR